MPQSPYLELLSSQRLKPTSQERLPVEEALSDKMRIVNCSAFRRLGGKAQVFSLARAGTVRDRLTHSIEVAGYGQLVAAKIADGLVSKERDALPRELWMPFVQTVENACLLHDIGNPPFGHMGEYAIREWFKTNAGALEHAWLKNNRLNGAEVNAQLQAFKNFDGNPQGLRIMTRLQWFDHAFGLNLTCSLLGAYCKYIGGVVSKADPFKKKIGFFPSERTTVTATWRQLGLNQDNDGTPAQRHPLAFIMEAADDIAYCISDIEDALEKKLVTEKQFIEFAEVTMPDLIKRARANAEKTNDWLMENGLYHYFRVFLSQELVGAAAQAYLESEKGILDGTHAEALLGNKSRRIAADMVKKFAGAHIYTSREAVEMVVGGLQAVTSILDAYRPMLLLGTEEFERLQNKEDFDRLKDFPMLSQLFSLLPHRQEIAYRWQVEQNPKLEPVYRTQLVIDYLSGMTDTHALKIYNMINGTQPFGVE
ncbi:MAG: dNTP triphosphohydrolase [Gemmatimonadetes bacterium]|nr:dNTP triphosphohydrolase [Gemmatimonadota bacterium]